MPKKLSPLKILFIILGITIIFTALDVLVHNFVNFLTIDRYSIFNFLIQISDNPLLWYATGKFLATLVFGFIVLLFLNNLKLKTWMSALIFTSIIVVLLEIRYSFTGIYPITWIVFNIVNHFVILYIVSYVIFKIFKK